MSNKNVWGKGGIRSGDYKRHSVDRDVRFFVGWKVMAELFSKVSVQYRNVGIVGFETAGRITETLSATAEMFVVDTRFILVRNFPILKRWKAVDKVVYCMRCGTRNDEFAVQCSQCGANIIVGGKKKFVTERVPEMRIPFYIPLTEPFSADLIRIIKNRRSGLLFPSPYKPGKPYTRQWAHEMIKDFGRVVGLDTLYNHWFRAQRLTQLGDEYGFDRPELRAFSGIKRDETLAKYSKKIQSYMVKMGLHSI